MAWCLLNDLYSKVLQLVMKESVDQKFLDKLGERLECAHMIVNPEIRFFVYYIYSFTKRAFILARKKMAPVQRKVQRHIHCHFLHA